MTTDPGAPSAAPAEVAPPGHPAPSPPRRRRLTAAAVVFVSGAVVGAAVGAAVAAGVAGNRQQTIVERFFPNRSVLAHPADAQEVVAKVLPAVVSIHSETFQGNSLFGGSYAEGAGTGMILTPDGVVLTNNHVVAGASTVTVTLYGQTESRPAKVLGTDPAQDVALVRIEGVSGLPTVTLGDSSTARVGDEVLAIGNALDLAGGPSVTEGIVSALNRSLSAQDPFTGSTENLTGLIQTDAAINPGNSGGPLVDAEGQVIGMNTLVVDSSGSGSSETAQGLGFAIAIDTAKSLVPTLEQGGSGPTAHPGGAFLGVGLTDVTPALAAADSLSVSEGALVVAVTAGGPADQAGIQVGDVIVKIGDQAVTSAAAATAAVSTMSPGDQVAVTVARGTQRLTLTATLTTRPSGVS